ncbi:MAG: NADPH:quinone reductase [Pseudomonadota bacterium]
MTLATYYQTVGDAQAVLKTGEKPLPGPGAGEVQVRMMASGVNPSDVKKRAGARGEISDAFIIPHSDGAGVVDEIGSGVDDAWLGQRVWVCEAQHGRAFGTCAHECVVPVALIHPLPDNTSFVEGAAIPIPMMTAHRCLTSSGDARGKRILVTGASGRVGYYAVQMAREMGAEVVATVGSDAERTDSNNLGASHAFNFRDASHIEAMLDALGAASLDLIVDVEFGENCSRYLPLLKDNAVIASYSSSRAPTLTINFYDLMFRNIFVHPVLVYSMPDQAKTDAKASINDMLERGAIQHRIAHCVGLDRTAHAHELIESGCKGSVIVETQ